MAAATTEMAATTTEMAATTTEMAAATTEASTMCERGGRRECQNAGQNQTDK
jgi:methyl-accepting chemotaxis protein